MSFFSSYKHQVIAVSLTNLLVSLHGVRRVKCHGQNMNSEWYGRSKDFYKKSQSRLEALILMKCSIYIFVASDQVLRCEMPGSWHPAAFEKLTTTCSWERFKATEVKSQWKWPNFSIFVQKSLEPVDIILPQVKKELS